MVNKLQVLESFQDGCEKCGKDAPALCVRCGCCAECVGELHVDRYGDHLCLEPFCTGALKEMTVRSLYREAYHLYRFYLPDAPDVIYDYLESLSDEGEVFCAKTHWKGQSCFLGSGDMVVVMRDDPERPRDMTLQAAQTYGYRHFPVDSIISYNAECSLQPFAGMPFPVYDYPPTLIVTFVARILPDKKFEVRYGTDYKHPVARSGSHVKDSELVRDMFSYLMRCGYTWEKQ